MSADLGLAMTVTLVPLSYVLVWAFWTRPRLLVLRREAVSLRYRAPLRLVALYLLCTLIAPLTGSVVALAWLYASCRRLSHSWKQAA